LCQKSQNFVYALICYKQKCKVVSLNLAHPVGTDTKHPVPDWVKLSIVILISGHSDAQG